MYDEYHFTRDAAIASLDGEADGITVDEDDGVTIDWDEVSVVTVDDPPYAEAFDTKEFYKLSTTIAKPIRQPYHYGEDSVVWLKKPRAELKRAAWSVDNRPVTLSHPDTGMVKSVDDVRGFWRSPRYVDSLDDLDADAYIPVNDEEAQEHIEDHSDVSVGFYNEIARTDEYDGIVGGTDDEDDLDGYQTNMYFDHVAFVGTGRCSSEHGCGLDAAGQHGAIDEGGFKYTTNITDISETKGDGQMKETIDAPSGIYTEDGEWYGIAPSENPDGDSPKYPLNNCDDVQDAWNLRNHGNYSVDVSTLEARIKRVSESKNCPNEYKPWVDASTQSIDVDDVDYCIEPCQDCGSTNGSTDKDDTMSDTFDFSLDDLAADAAISHLADQHEGVEEIVDELESLRGVKETLGVDLDELDERVEEVLEKAEAYDEIKYEEMKEDAERLASMTDKYDDADAVLEAFDEDHDEIVDRIELIEDVSGDVDETETTETTTDSSPSDPEQEIRTKRMVPDAWT